MNRIIVQVLLENATREPDESCPYEVMVIPIIPTRDPCHATSSHAATLVSYKPH